MGDDDKDEKPKRIVGENAAPAVWHDHISSILFVANLGLVGTLAVMAMSNNTLTLPAFLTGYSHTSMAQDMHLATTAAGLAFAGVLGIVAVWLLLLWTSAYAVIIGGQLVMFVSLITAAGLAFAIGQHNGDVHKVLSFVPKHVSIPSAEVLYVEAMAAADAPAADQNVAVYYYVTSIVFVVLAVVLVTWLFCIRERIAFTAAVLSNVAKVLLQLPELLALQLIACALVLGYAALWAFAAIEINARASAANQGALVFFLMNCAAVLSFFWGQLVLINISLVTTCGAIGHWYHEPLTAFRGGCLCRPAVCGPLSRACTTSLGSIALGSLLVAIIRTIIAVVKYVGDLASQGNPILKMAFCCCACCLGCLESILEWLTDYAFVYIALYGTHFMDAGVKVVKLLNSSGVGAIAQQTLIAPVLRLAAFLGLGAGVALGYCAMIITGVQGVTYIGMVVGGGVGYVLTQLLLAPVDAAAKTIFVCYAEEPNGLIGKAPELAEKIAENKSLKSSSPEDNVVAP
jgi:hypothetical protein